jgi:hypothetical protein
MTDTHLTLALRRGRAPMRPVRLNTSALVLAAVLVATGCGNAAEGGKGGEDTTNSSADSSPSSAAREKITQAGLAALVADHLGKDAVASFGSYGPEPGEVYVMVRLRGGGRADMFSVSVMSPKQGGRELAGAMGKCPTAQQRKRMGGDMKEFTCHRLQNGTTVTAYLVSSGFSDDNARGLVVTGVGVAHDKSTTMAMYESYDKTPQLTVTELDKLLSDPRMAWMTDPTTNKAGNSIKIKNLRG